MNFSTTSIDSNKPITSLIKMNPRPVVCLAIAYIVMTNLHAQESTPPSADQSNNRVAKMVPGTCTMPKYPEQEVNARHEGLTVLVFKISPEGLLEGFDVEKSSGYPALDTAAAKGLSTCTFRPPIENGVRVAGKARIEYKWVLENKPGRFTFGPNLSQCPALEEPANAPKRSSIVTTRIRLDFLRNGHVSKVSVETPSGSELLDDAAVFVYQQCVFDPKYLVELPGASPKTAMPFVSTAIIEDHWPPTAFSPRQ